MKPFGRIPAAGVLAAIILTVYVAPLFLSISGQSWFVGDWIRRAVFVLVFLLHPVLRDYVRTSFKTGPRLVEFRDAGVAILAILCLDWTTRYFYWRFGFADAFLHPAPGAYDTVAVRLFDLTVGLALVAVSEELIYRVGLIRELEIRRLPTWLIYGLGTAVFGFAHWPASELTVFGALVDAPIYIWLFRRHRSIWSLIIVHYVYNLLVFSGGLANLWL